MVLFGRKQGVGVEIDSGVVRAVQLNASGDSCSVSAVGSMELPPDAVVEGVVEEVEEVREALYRLWRKGNFSYKDVVLGVCTQGLFMRIITFPSVPEDRLSDALRLQADEHFPFPTSELIIDHEVLDQLEDEEGNLSLQILLVAVRREHVTPNLQALTDAGLKVNAVDAASLGLIRTAELAADLSTGATVLCNIGNSLNSVLLVSDNRPAFARISRGSFGSLLGRVNVPAQMLLATAACADDFSAESPELQAAVASWSEQIASEIESSVAYFSSRNNQQPDELFLSGIGARVRGLPRYLQEELQLPVTVLDPFAHLSLPDAAVNVGSSSGPDFGVALGLALRGLEE